jgi:phosphoribosyl-ATP pyrophosphohydrolase/phosphoribosyl-AMP cyclohydrolase
MSVDPAALAYDRDGLVACICQDAATNDVLMLAWADREAVERTLATGRAWFWSRSRGELWEKGATSGNTLEVVDVRADCDGDALLLRVRPAGPACHTGDETCWGPRRAFPAALARTIAARREADPAGSYVARLLHGPREHAARKVGEEATEVLLAEPGSDAQVGEVADLVFHALLLLARDGRDPLDALAELERRQTGSKPDARDPRRA